jgi:hypothetical protein
MTHIPMITLENAVWNTTGSQNVGLHLVVRTSVRYADAACACGARWSTGATTRIPLERIQYKSLRLSCPDCGTVEAIDWKTLVQLRN